MLLVADKAVNVIGISAGESVGLEGRVNETTFCRQAFVPVAGASSPWRYS
jgi:hypothetical protein